MIVKKKRVIYLLAFIFVLGAFLRFYNLDKIPPGLYPDEAANGNNALEAFKNESFNVFYPENNGREGLFINLVAYSIKYLGIRPLSIRIVSAIIGSLTIIGIYLLARTLFLSESIALFSSFFLSISFWHLNFSRIGFRAIMVPFFLVFSFYFLLEGLKKKDVLKIIIAGFIFSLGFYSYIAWRASSILLLLVCFFDFLENKKNLTSNLFWQKWLIFLLVVIVFCLPLINYFVSHPEDFLSRTKQISVFADKNPLGAFLKNFFVSLLMFNFKGDGNWRHNLAQSPQLFYFQGVLFLLGVYLVLKNIKKKEMAFLLFGLIIMLLPSALTREGIPHALRSIGAIPFVFILIGLGADFLWQKAKTFLPSRKRKVILVLFLLVLFLITFQRYFLVWAKKREVKDAFCLNYLTEGQHLNSLPENMPKYVVCWAGGVPFRERGEERFLPMPCQTIMFITNSFLPEPREKKNIHYLLPEETKSIFEPGKKNVVIYIK